MLSFKLFDSISKKQLMLYESNLTTSIASKLLHNSNTDCSEIVGKRKCSNVCSNGLKLETCIFC